MTNKKIFKTTPRGDVIELPGIEPFYLAAPDTDDPAIISYVETLFWIASFKEHSETINLLLPDLAPLSKYRDSTKKHNEIFKGLEQKAKGMDPDSDGLDDILNRTEKHGKMIVSELEEMITKQESGEIRTLIWPSFMKHLKEEGEYFLDRKEMILKKEVEYKKEEIIPFWLEIMAEHTMFTAHFLDPEEIDAIDQAWEANFKLYEDLQVFEESDEEKRIADDLEGLIAFKADLVDKVTSGEVSSIIFPALAEHMRKEAIYFKDILDRAQ